MRGGVETYGVDGVDGSDGDGDGRLLLPLPLGERNRDIFTRLDGIKQLW
jgi:hypothetical protein